MHDVLELLRARRAGSREDDGARIALVLEGGGMRGIISCAQAYAIEKLGLTPCFDLVVGASAGGLNGAAFVAGVAEGCARDYAEVFSARPFLDTRRALVRRPVFDVAATLAWSSPHLDEERHLRAIRSPVGLHVVATDVASGAVIDLSGFADVTALHQALLATTRLPLIGGPPVVVDGRALIDGGVVEPIPVAAARRAGATHVLALLTRRAGEPAEGAGGVADRLLRRWLRSHSAGLAEAYAARPASYAALVAELEAASADPGSSVLALQPPPDTPPVSRTERDPRLLRLVAAKASQAAFTVLDPAL